MLRSVAYAAVALAIAGICGTPASARGVKDYRVLQPLAPEGRRDKIVDAAVGSDGSLWLTAIRGSGGSLVRVDRANRIVSYAPEQAATSSDNFLFGAIERGAAGHLWLQGATWAEGGVHQGDFLQDVGTDGAVKRTIWLPPRSYAYYPTPTVTGRAGELWIAYNGPPLDPGDPFALPVQSPGFLRFEPRTAAFTDFPMPQLPEVLASRTPLISGGAGVLWGGDDPGLKGTRIWRIAPATAKQTHVATLSGGVNAMAADSGGRVWISAPLPDPRGGPGSTPRLLRVDPSSGKLTRVRVVGAILGELAAGGDGAMWALVTECVRPARCAGGLIPSGVRTRTTLVRFPKKGRATRFALPRETREAHSLHVAPGRRMWLTLPRRPGSGYVQRVASFTIPRG